MEEQILQAYLRLTLNPEFGASRLGSLLQRFGQLSAAMEAVEDRQSPRAPSLSEHDILARAFEPADKATEKATNAAMQWREQPGCELVTYQAKTYPQLLREVTGAPPLLFAQGQTALLHSACCAIVGSRAASHYGERHSRWFAHQLASFGFTIVSGLAKGIDAAAHRGALQAEGATIAVMGTGIDQIYPRNNQTLFEQIIREGLVLSEFPLGFPPRAEHFPQRNRIIAGLSLGTLVVEGSLRSGSLITARLAMEQGRDVFAMPGPIHNGKSRGCHKLLRDGAALVEDPDEICSKLLEHWHHPRPLRSNKTKQTEDSVSSNRVASGLTKDQQKIAAALTEQDMLLDQLISLTGLSVAAVTSAVLQMEIRGILKKEGGRVYRV
jgi:DNA processing protein